MIYDPAKVAARKEAAKSAAKKEGWFSRLFGK
jgi:hypothetical protein